MRRALLATALLAGVCGGVTGCAEMAAAEAAANAVGTAKAALDTVPSAIRAVADMAVVNNNKTDWGKPSAVHVTKHRYVFFYPTPESELRQGRIRAVVVEKDSRAVRLLEKQRGA
jgi:hypothetical protein